MLGEIRIVENDIRALAAELLADPFDRGRGVFGNVDARATSSR